jgi:L-iditol 2-dehydrogenase
MKAYVLHDIDDLRFEDVTKPIAGDREVLVEVKAAGICGSDIPRIYRTGTYSYPLIPGHEFAGTVVETGADVDSKWLQKRVGVFPLLPCHDCEPCRQKHYELCRHYSYLGSRQDGAFAEYVAVPEENLIALPDEAAFEEAAMLEPMAVAVHAMRRCAPKPEQTIAVCGLGTIGLLLLMFLREAGNQNILVIGNKEFQRQKAISLGIPEENYCDSKSTDTAEWLLGKTDGRGVDLFFECVGRNETVNQALAATAPNGYIQLIGNPASDMQFDKALYWKILRNQLTLKGTWNSSFTHEEEDDWHYVLKRLKEHRIRPSELISHKVGFDSLEEGLHIMRDKTEDYVKVMMMR